MFNQNNTAILLVSCPDRKGIVAGVADFLYRHNANILHADEHRDNELNIFFLRTEWSMSDFSLDIPQFKKEFLPIAKKFSMKWAIAQTDKKPRIAVFASKEDHCLVDLLSRQKSGELAGDIALVISNYTYSKPLVEFYKIPFFEIPSIKDQAEMQALTLLNNYKVDVAVLARYMQILSKDFLESFNKPIINIHHSFLPAFIGARPYHQAYERGVKLIGATSHYVTEILDNGPIIEQDVVRVTHRDSVGSLIQKGRDLEKIVLYRAVKWHCENKVLQYGNKTVVFD